MLSPARDDTRPQMVLHFSGIETTADSRQSAARVDGRSDAEAAGFLGSAAVSGRQGWRWLVLAPPPAGAQALVPAGAEFQVNTYSALFQSLPSVQPTATGTSWWCGPATGSLGPTRGP